MLPPSVQLGKRGVMVIIIYYEKIHPSSSWSKLELEHYNDQAVPFLGLQLWQNCSYPLTLGSEGKTFVNVCSFPISFHDACTGSWWSHYDREEMFPPWESWGLDKLSIASCCLLKGVRIGLCCQSSLCWRKVIRKTIWLAGVIVNKTSWPNLTTWTPPPPHDQWYSTTIDYFRWQCMSMLIFKMAHEWFTFYQPPTLSTPLSEPQLMMLQEGTSYPTMPPGRAQRFKCHWNALKPIARGRSNVTCLPEMSKAGPRFFLYFGIFFRLMVYSQMAFQSHLGCKE